MTQNRYLDETYFEGDIFALTAAILQWRALDQTLIKKVEKNPGPPSENLQLL